MLVLARHLDGRLAELKKLELKFQRSDQPQRTSRQKIALDTTSRSLTRHGQRVLLSDTVGFIRPLPERMLASLESTMAEFRAASLLLVGSTLPITAEHHPGTVG